MRELEMRWSYRDIVEAHEMLDALEDADWRAHEQSRRDADSRRSADRHGAWA